MGNMPQHIILTELNGNRFEGKIVTKLSQSKKDRSWVGEILERLFEKEKQDIEDVLTLNDSINKSLMKELKTSNIENIYFFEHKRCVACSATFFNISKGYKSRFYYYNDLHPTSKGIIVTELYRVKGQKLLDIIDKELNLKSKFREVFNRIPKGWYNYSNGLEFIQIESKVGN